MRGANAGKLQRTWGEFMSNSPIANITGWNNPVFGSGNRAKASRQGAADSASYTEYLKSQGLGNNALSKEEFLAQSGNKPKVDRTWGEFLGNGILANMTGWKSPWLGGAGNSSWQARQEKAENDAYNAYLKQNAINNGAMPQQQAQQPMPQQPMPQQPMPQQPMPK